MTLTRAGWVGALLALTGCADIIGFGPSSEQITRLALRDGSVIGTAPNGYCFETRASRTADGFAVLADCAVIAGTGDLSAPNGFVTVQVGETGSGLGSDVSVLAAFLETDAGKTLLSQTGTAGDIRVRSVASRLGGVTVRFVDGAAPPVAGLQQTEWRGFFDIKGRLTTVAVRGLDAAPLGTDDGQALLENVMRAMQQANGGADNDSDA